MYPSFLLLSLAVLVAAFSAPDARAEKKTVCTITVNSADEKEIFKRSLPSDEYDFVELVERGRSDWLASACRAGVKCDMLVISGHFDDGDEFYSDRLDMREHLPVEEMERVSCSASCPGLFSQLKEVYLFGCNTLNADPRYTASGEIGRSLARSGHSGADADRITRSLNEKHGESNRDRMRQIFVNVPVIYGFSSKAPLGPTAATLLDRYFQSGARGEIGSGRASPKLLGLFAPSSMTVAAGLNGAEALADYRSDVCHFVDDRLSPAQKIAFVHDLLRREMAVVRMFLPHLEKYVASLRAQQPLDEALAKAFAEIANDAPARTRYLEFARDADETDVRVRMLKVANRLGWLSAEQLHAELVSTIRERLAKTSVGPGDVELFCVLNADHRLDDAPASIGPVQAIDKTGHAAVLACLGSNDGRARVMRALTSGNDDDAQIAQVYLRHHPLDAAELRDVATGIARMKTGDAQIRALDTLARYHVSDRETLDALARLFPSAKSVAVQRAIAGVLVRADYAQIATPDIVRTLRQHRLKSSDGQDMIDVLIRRLQSS